MNRPQNHLVYGLLLGILFSYLGTARADDAPVADPLQELQGTWVRQQQTPTGMVKVVKVHEGNSSTVTGYDPQGKVFYQHVSEFSVDTTGKVDTLTFFNRKIVVGQGAGTLIKQPSTYIYRIEDDRFYEAQGLLANDPLPVRVIVWQREPPAGKPPGRAPPADDP